MKATLKVAKGTEFATISKKSNTAYQLAEDLNMEINVIENTDLMLICKIIKGSVQSVNSATGKPFIITKKYQLAFDAKNIELIVDTPKSENKETIVKQPIVKEPIVPVLTTEAERPDLGNTLPKFDDAIVETKNVIEFHKLPKRGDSDVDSVQFIRNMISNVEVSKVKVIKTCKSEFRFEIFFDVDARNFVLTMNGDVLVKLPIKAHNFELTTKGNAYKAHTECVKIIRKIADTNNAEIKAVEEALAAAAREVEINNKTVAESKDSNTESTESKESK